MILHGGMAFAVPPYFFSQQGKANFFIQKEWEGT